MPRARSTPTAEKLPEARTRMKSGLPRGSRRKVSAEDEIIPQELEHMKTMAVILKVVGFSYTYIGETIGASRGLVKGWFDEPEMCERVSEAQAALTDKAIELLRRYSIEAVEGIAEIARRTEDDSLRLKAWTEILDRLPGLSKTSRSESKSESEHTEKLKLESDSLLDKLADKSPEVQRKVAEMYASFETELAALMEGQS